MIKQLPNEKWQQVKFDDWELMQNKYAISNMGRLASYQKSPAKDGRLLNGSGIEGYRVLRMKVNGNYKAFLFHRMVAEAFCKKANGADLVIHKNFNKQDNRASNLSWATQNAVAEHNKKSPEVLAYRKRLQAELPLRKKGLKLTLAQVKQIKKILQSRKRKLTYKQMAEKFGVSEMAITRIKRGENWAHVNP